MPRVHLALVVVAVLFSVNYILMKLVLVFLSPLALSFLRVVGSTLLLFAVTSRWTHPGAERFTRREIGSLFLFAFLGIVANGVLFVAGLSLTSAHKAAILITTIPIFTLMAAILLSRERATTRKVAGIVLAAAGAFLIVGREGVLGDRGSFLGDLLILLNCLSYALYLVLSRPLMLRHSPIRVVSWLFAIGALLMLPFSVWSVLRIDWKPIPWTIWLAFAAIVAGPTVGAYLLNAWALAQVDSSMVAAYTYLQPLLTSILAAAFLGEKLRPMVLGAATLIFAGVYLASRNAPAAEAHDGV